MKIAYKVSKCMEEYNKSYGAINRASLLRQPLAKHKILLCLKFNKCNKQNVCYINLFKKNSTFLSLKIIVQTDWCQEWKIK